MTRDTLDTRILDELADGQWHPATKIAKNISKPNQKLPLATKPTREVLLDRLQVLVDEGTIQAGNNTSFRFRTEHLESWRDQSQSLDKSNASYLPRYFGGILEDDGWERAPLRTVDLIHFRVGGDLKREVLLAWVGDPKAAIQIDQDNNLYRIFTSHGDEVYARVKAAKEEQPAWEISSIRLEANLKRRDLEELPARYVSDMCRYYGTFSKVLLRPHMSTLVKMLPDQDDQQQQIFIWVIEAIQRYDDSTSIPFGAYLGTSLHKWVFNLTRRQNGRSAADTELRYTRAISKFRLEHEREPKDEELAQLLGSDVETVRKDMRMISTVVNLRNTSAIFTDDNEIPLPSEDMVEDNIEELAEKTLLSATVTTAAMRLDFPQNIVSLYGVYHENWGGDNRSKKVAAWLNLDSTKRSVHRVLTNAKALIEGRK